MLDYPPDQFGTRAFSSSKKLKTTCNLVAPDCSS